MAELVNLRIDSRFFGSKSTRALMISRNLNIAPMEYRLKPFPYVSRLSGLIILQAETVKEKDWTISLLLDSLEPSTNYAATLTCNHEVHRPNSSC